MTGFDQNASDTERHIARVVVQRALRQGYTVSVRDGYDGDIVTVRSRKLNDILATLASTDSDILIIRNVDGELIGSVILIWGNDEDLISDCSDNDAIEDITRFPYTMPRSLPLSAYGRRY